MPDDGADGRGPGARRHRLPIVPDARSLRLLSLFLPVLLLVTGIVRIVTSDYSLWFDELASTFFASQPLFRLWSGWMLRETNPPLFYSLLHIWTGIAGMGTVTLRLPSIFASLAAIAVVHAGMRRHYGPGAAVMASLLMAVSAQQMFFAQEVRSYMMLFLAIALSFFGLARIAGAEAPPRRAWIAYAGGALVAIYLHTTACLWPAAASLALMAVDRRARPFAGSRWWELVLANVAILVGAGWWIGMTLLQMRHPNGNLSWMGTPSWASILDTFENATLLVRHPRGWGHLAALGVAGLALFGAVRTWASPTTRLAVACLLLAAALFLALNLKQPVILDRTLLWLSLFVILLAAAGVASLRPPVIGCATGAVLLALLGANLAAAMPHFQIEDWRTPVLRMAGHPGAVLLVEGEAQSIAADMSCAIQWGHAPCPFPIATLERDGRTLDSWARGFARPIPPDFAVEPPTQLFLFRRWCSDSLALLHDMDVLRDVEAKGQDFIGPYPAPVIARIFGKARREGGLLRVAHPGECR